MSGRMTRINERVREVVADAVQDLQDPRIGFVTITGVDVARDFRTAKVHVSVLGSDDELASTLDALEHAHGKLQGAVARGVRMQHTPRLHFIHDDTIDSAMRIEQLLREEPAGGAEEGDT